MAECDDGDEDGDEFEVGQKVPFEETQHEHVELEGGRPSGQKVRIIQQRALCRRGRRLDESDDQRRDVHDGQDRQPDVQLETVFGRGDDREPEHSVMPQRSIFFFTPVNSV